MLLIRTMSEAVRCAEIVKKHACVPVMIFVFGSVARWGFGWDIDLLIEVSPVTFHRYYKIHADGNRAHPFLKRPYEPSDTIWDYFRPNQLRTAETLRELCGPGQYAYEELIATVPSRSLDMICVPSDWRERGGESRAILDSSVRRHDPQFFRKVEATAKFAM